MKGVKILIVAGVIGFLGYMVIAITLKYAEGEAHRKRISTLPSFKLERLGNGFFTDADLTANRPLILLYFNSTCEFCRAEAREIKNKIESFKEIQLVFVSTEEKIDIKNFAEENGLCENANVVFLQDTNMEFSRIFDVKSVPVTYLYNQHRQLMGEFKGAVNVASMVEALQNKPGFK